jgi:hypothetical protein
VFYLSILAGNAFARLRWFHSGLLFLFSFSFYPLCCQSFLLSYQNSKDATSSVDRCSHIVRTAVSVAELDGRPRYGGNYNRGFYSRPHGRPPTTVEELLNAVVYTMSKRTGRVYEGTNSAQLHNLASLTQRLLPLLHVIPPPAQTQIFSSLGLTLNSEHGDHKSPLKPPRTNMDSNHMSKISQGVQDLLRHELEFLRDEEERCLSEEREAIQALNMFPLYDDALEMIHINDDTYSYPTAPPSFQLLGLMDNDNTLWSFLRLLRLHKSIQERIAPQSNIRLLDDGMLDATPKSQEDKRISHRNAQYPRLLSLPVEVRNQIFAEAIGGFSIFVKSKRMDFEHYTHQELSQITTRIRFLNPSNQTPLHEAWLQVQKENLLTGVTVSNHTSTVVITRTNSIHGSKENNPFFALQSTCRQLYTETALLPFSRINRFWYYDDRALSVLKRRITPGQY